MTTLTDITTLVIESCPTCGVRHGIPADLRQQALDRPGQGGKSLYCPNGHGWHFDGKSDAQREREAREAAERQVQRLQAVRTDLERRLAGQERQTRAQKAAKTRIKNRIAKGVCPCCNRTFGNLGAHMATMHPGFAAAEET